MENPSPTMNPCRFLRLPGELRNRIYELALSEPNGIPLTIDRKKFTSCRRTRPSNDDFNTADKGYTYSKPLLLGLPLTSRQIRAETLKIYYSINELRLYFEGVQIPGYRVDLWNAAKQGKQLQRWCKKVGVENAKEVRRLRLDFGAMASGGQADKCLELANLFTRRARKMLHSKVELGFEIDLGRTYARVGVPASAIRVELGELEDATEKVATAARLARQKVDEMFGEGREAAWGHWRVDEEELVLLSFVGRIPREVKCHMPPTVSGVMEGTSGEKE